MIKFSSVVGLLIKSLSRKPLVPKLTSTLRSFPTYSKSHFYLKTSLLQISTHFVPKMEFSSTSNTSDQSANEEDHGGAEGENERENENGDGKTPFAESSEEIKQKWISDLAAICGIDLDEAKSRLVKNSWDVQICIDEYLAPFQDEDEEMGPEDLIDKTERISENTNNTQEPEARPSSEPTAVFSPEGAKEKIAEIEVLLPASPSSNTTTWAPEKFTILSWNLDGLDSKNLDKRCQAVVDLVEKEKHDILFFQELIPTTFQYIATRLMETYLPILGTEDPEVSYMTATFLRLRRIIYEDHYIVPYPQTAMERNILVTKAFTGQAQLYLVNTHLESTAEFTQERVSQLKQCFELCKTFPENSSVIFGGDLNLRDKEVIGVMPHNMSDMWIKCGARKTAEFTWDLTRNTNKQMPSKFQPRCRFDRLYFRESKPSTVTPDFFALTGIEKVTGTQTFPSDHWAIVCSFKLSKEARKPKAKKRKADE